MRGRSWTFQKALPKSPAEALASTERLWAKRPGPLPAGQRVKEQAAERRQRRALPIVEGRKEAALGAPQAGTVLGLSPSSSVIWN